MSFYRDANATAAVRTWNTAERAGYETLKISPLSPTIGAEIEGIDLRRELSSGQLEEVRRALSEKLVLVFRDQDISPEQHKRFARHFGSLHQHVLAAQRKVAGDDTDTEIMSWRTDADSRHTAGNAWHHDVSCDEHPIIASFLRLSETPHAGAGDTAFSNMYLAYESLSDAFKGFLDGLTAVHDGAQLWAAGYGAKPEPGKAYAATEHPVVPTHPHTGRKFLYVNEAFTTHIVQLTKAESDSVLATLFRHVERSLMFQVRVHWKPNTLVAWDNWATQHHAVWDYALDFPRESGGLF